MVLTKLIYIIFLNVCKGQIIEYKHLMTKYVNPSCQCSSGSESSWNIVLKSKESKLKNGALISPWHVLTDKAHIKESYPNVQRFELHPHENLALLFLRKPHINGSQACTLPKKTV